MIQETSYTHRASRAVEALKDAGDKGLTKFQLAVAIRDPQPARAVSEARKSSVPIITKMEKARFLIFGTRKQARYIYQERE